MPLLDRFLFEVTGLSQTLRVVRFAGREGLSELFQFELVIACEDGAIAAADVVGKPALLSLKTDDGDLRYVSGVIARFACGDSGKKVTLYHLTLVPKHWRLLHRNDCRIYQELTAPEIIEKVFTTAGLASGDDFRLSLQAAHAKREYCVQYRESDWAFACRLMEEEGIYYFFEHTETGHVLVLGDKPAAHTAIAGTASLPYRPPLGALSDAEHVSRIHYSEEVRPGKFTLRDYDFKKPTLLLEGTSSGSDDTDLEIYDHPGDYEVPADGTSLAKLRLEEATAWKKRGEGDSACRRFVPGYKFTLAEHPREALNQEWLITHVEHRGAEPLGGESAAEATIPYENHFECIPATVPFRPPLTTPRPTVRGVQSAIVVGPAGEEIHTDEHGRVKVHFHWDRLGKKDDKDSCWIRVSQVWAGEAWGAMHIPRIGQEVLVDFMDGDPDRPIIVGRVYHGTNVPPYALPANKTRSTIKSNSTPGGGGSNELCFEDKAGSEEIYLHGQKDWTIVIENDKNQTIGHDETLSVKHDRKATVGNDQTESIGHDETFSVGNDRAKKVTHDETEEIGHDRTISVANDHTESIGNNFTLSVAKSRAVDIGENTSDTIGKAMTTSVGTDYGLDIKGDMTTAVGSNQSEDVKLEKTITVGNKLTITVGDAKVTVEKNGNITVEGATLAIKASADVKIEAGGKVEVKATGDVKVESSGKVEVKSSGATNVEASGAVKVKGSNVAIN